MTKSGKNGSSITISRFLDNDSLSTFCFLDKFYCDGEEYTDWMFISPDFDVIGEKESLAVAEFSQWLHPFGYILENSDNYYWKFDCQISIDGQTVSNPYYDYFYYNPNLVCAVDLLPYGNAFGGNHQIKVTATDGYNSLSVDTVLSYHPIDTILTPHSLVIDVNSGMGGCSLFVDDEEVELSNDGPGTPAHIYALPRKDYDYSITVQVGNFIATSDYGEKVDELYVYYQGRCQETTIVVPAKEIIDFEEDGVYYSITGENKVTVTRSEKVYQGIITIPTSITYEGVTYNVTGISSGAFAGATLQSLILPVTISNVESGAFDGCHINSLVITGEGNWMAGAISGTIDNLYVMSSVTGIEGLLVNPTTVYSYATVPSTCNDNTFTGYDGELHVPASSLASYFTAPYWSNFINIVGDAVEPTGISLYKDSIEVLVGNQLNLNATVSPSNATPKNLIWTTSDGQIATVTNGVITGIKAGECDIKAFLLDKSATCHVTVTEIVPTDVSISQEFAKLEIGSQLTLTATVAPDNATDKQVTWASTNSAVATVDSLGHVTAVDQGECFISATCRDKQALCHVIVVDHFIYITLDEHDVRLLPNHMMTLTPSVSPANTSLVVTSSNPSVAAARMANGRIQLVGIKEGSTLITVNSTDGYAEVDSCLVRVYTLRGDVNSDGFVNITDVTSLINRLLNGPAPTISEENADANNDGSVTIADVTALISSLLSGEPLPPKEDSTESSETFTVNGVTFTMVAVEGGTFTMGATPEQGDDALDAERPAHQVTLSSYAIGQTEVTQALWVAVMGTNPSRFSGRPNNPVEGVTWNDCQAFITQLNALTGKSFRLPTEAEWEYAARGGNKSQGYKYAGSNDINEVAWYTDNSTSTQPVATKKANELGLYDMSGNVWEWCQDYYGDYSSEAQTNPTGPEGGSDRVRRGVGWNGSAVSARVSHRSSRAPTYKYNSLGLRLAL